MASEKHNEFTDPRTGTLFRRNAQGELDSVRPPTPLANQPLVCQ